MGDGDGPSSVCDPGASISRLRQRHNRENYDIVSVHDAQRAAAEETIAALEREHVFDAPIVTEETAAETFHPAEDYHRDYFERNPNQPYCQYVVAPKVAKLRAKFAARLRAS